MIIIPAIDIKDRKCVRLSQGRLTEETIYSENPVEVAIRWESMGAERLHIVDLNGAVTGKPFHRSLIKEIVQSIRIPVEVGGGIRDLETVEYYLNSGIRWVVLGTVAFKNPSLVEEACRLFPGHMIIAIDLRKGKISVEGWNEETPLGIFDLVKRFDSIGPSSFIVTDIERDGMATGLNYEMVRELAMNTKVPIIASGGVSRIEDIEGIMELEPQGVIGVIIGRALYNGNINLEEAIQLTKRLRS